MSELQKILKKTWGIQSAIARHLKVPPQTVSAWSRGLAKVPIQVAKIMESEFGIPKYISRPDVWECDK